MNAYNYHATFDFKRMGWVDFEIKVPIFLVVVAGAGVVVVSWLRTLLLWRGPAIIPIGLGVYGLLHAGWIAVYLMTSGSNDSVGIGSVLTAIAFLVMLILIFKQIRP